MNSTNIVTTRYYDDGTIAVSINGRELQDVLSMSTSPELFLGDDTGGREVSITFRAAQVNVLRGDAPVPVAIPASPSPPLPSWVRPGDCVIVDAPKCTWTQRFNDWLNNRGK